MEEEEEEEEDEIDEGEDKNYDFFGDERETQRPPEPQGVAEVSHSTDSPGDPQ